MSKNIILIVKIDFSGRGRGVVFGRGNKRTKAFLLLIAILPIFFNVYLSKNIPYQYSLEWYHTNNLFWNVFQCQSLQRKLRAFRQRNFRRIFFYLSWTWSKSKWENNNGFLIYWCHNPFAIGSRISKCWKFRPALQASWTSWEQQNAFINDNGIENVPKRLHISWGKSLQNSKFE